MTLFERASRYINVVREIPGPKHHPLIQWWLSLCSWDSESSDETPWCSAALNGWCWDERLPRSKSAAARSWLAVGEAIPLELAQVGFDVVVLRRGKDPKAGHVGLYAGRQPNGQVLVLGGNQGNTVSVSAFPAADVVGVRRLAA